MTVLNSSRWPELTSLLEAKSLSESAITLVTSVLERPDLPKRLAKMALLLRSKKLKKDAKAIARAARALDEADNRVRIMTEWSVREEVPVWHFSIVGDELRNQTYNRALEVFVKPGMTVFEIGTGTGILAMLAVRAGARHVYTVEREPEVAKVAQAIIARNKMADRITVIAKDAHDVVLGVDLPERADVFVAELVDNSLLGEDVLPLTALARERFLKPEAILLPRQISAVGCVVSGNGDFRKRVRMNNAMGFDLTPFNRFSPVLSSCDSTFSEEEKFLSESKTLIHFDLSQDVPQEATLGVNLKITKSGTAEGVIRWLRLDFGEEISYENRPPQESCWSPQIHLFREPQAVAPGDDIEVEAYYKKSDFFLFPKAINHVGVSHPKRI